MTDHSQENETERKRAGFLLAAFAAKALQKFAETKIK